MSIRWRYPFKTTVRETGFEEVSRVFVLESWAGDGDPYFLARVALTDGTIIDLAEGQDRDLCEATCIRFRAALQERSMAQQPA
jgi:hypothetical protein